VDLQEEGMLETLHLLRSRANAKRLLRSIRKANAVEPNFAMRLMWTREALEDFQHWQRTDPKLGSRNQRYDG
jgi:hypothetical protein